MKKVLALILAAVMILAVASCGPKKPVETTGGNDTTPAVTTPEATTPEETTGEEKPETPAISDALDLLNKVWATWDEEMMFPVMGGDLFSEDHMVSDAPGKYHLDNEQIAAALDSTFGVPQDSASLIVDAASMIHMMNANTFTCGAFRLKSASDVASFAAALKENVVVREWMCGFPDTLVVISVGDYVVSAFGNGELIEAFKTKTLAAIDGAKLLYEESLAF